MKKSFYFSLFFLCLCTLTSYGVENSKAANNTGNVVGGENQSRDYEWVDLGLSSGTLWATMNVGASKPEDCGDYFYWGETSPMKKSGTVSEKWNNTATDSYTKYNPEVDNRIELEPSDDAAYVNWGSKWRIPTKEQFDELHAECAWYWTGNGYLVSSNNNGKTLFLPAAGCRYKDSLDDVGSLGIYWTRSLFVAVPSLVYILHFESDHVSVDDGSRSFGRSVRAVRVP